MTGRRRSGQNEMKHSENGQNFVGNAHGLKTDQIVTSKAQTSLPAISRSKKLVVLSVLAILALVTGAFICKDLISNQAEIDSPERDLESDATAVNGLGDGVTSRKPQKIKTRFRPTDKPQAANPPVVNLQANKSQGVKPAKATLGKKAKPVETDSDSDPGGAEPTNPTKPKAVHKKGEDALLKIDFSDDEAGEAPKKHLSHFVGISNLGNTCFANSVMQILHHLSGFRELLKSFLKTQNLAVGLEKFRSMQVMYLLIKLMDKTESKKNALAKYSYGMSPNCSIADRSVNTICLLPEGLRDYKQHDPADIFEYIFGLPLDFSAVNVGLNAFKSLEYHNGAKEDSDGNNDVYPELKLEIETDPDKKTLLDSLETYFSERIDPTEDEVEAGAKDAFVKKQVLSFPQSIIIRLNRAISTTQSVKTRKKINDIIRVEEYLSFAKYIKEDLKEKLKSQSRYELVGFIKHIGKTLDSGHYISFIKDTEHGGVWYEMNDGTVSKLGNFPQGDANSSYYYIYRQLADTSEHQ